MKKIFWVKAEDIWSPGRFKINSGSPQCVMLLGSEGGRSFHDDAVQKNWHISCGDKRVCNPWAEDRLCNLTASPFLQYRTSVEMEALVGVSMSLNTLWDMVKYLEKDEEGQYPDTRITDIKVLSKKKG